MKPLILWGGTDISPHWYDEPANPATDTPDLERDQREFDAVRDAVAAGQPIIGVCRGAQLLCVYNKGKLHQHVSEHRNNNHPLMCRTGIGVDGIINYVVLHNIAADHHQCMIPEGNHVLYAFAGDNNPEVVWWPETKCLAVQPHPEWMQSEHEFNVWLNKLLVELGIEHKF